MHNACISTWHIMYWYCRPLTESGEVDHQIIPNNTPVKTHLDIEKTLPFCSYDSRIQPCWNTLPADLFGGITLIAKFSPLNKLFSELKKTELALDEWFCSQSRSLYIPSPGQFIEEWWRIDASFRPQLLPYAHCKFTGFSFIFSLLQESRW